MAWPSPRKAANKSTPAPRRQQTHTHPGVSCRSLKTGRRRASEGKATAGRRKKFVRSGNCKKKNNRISPDIWWWCWCKRDGCRATFASITNIPNTHTCRGVGVGEVETFFGVRYMTTKILVNICIVGVIVSDSVCLGGCDGACV